MPSEPAFPSDAVEFQPPAVYRLWWNLVERCSGKTGDFSAVRFYDVPGKYIVDAAGDSANGYWFSNGDRILVGEYRMYEGPLLRHEMLHALLRKTEGTGHPAEYFVDKCGGVVHCQGACLANEPPPALPDAGAPRVQASAMQLEARVDPAPFDSTTYDGWAAITVTVTNPFTNSVWVDAPIASLGFTFANGLTQQAPLFASPVPFTPLQVRQQVFDVKLAGGTYRLAPGTYDLRGIFAEDTGAVVKVEIR